MSTITIPIFEGYNYLSFPATSTDNFGTIFLNSNLNEDIISRFEKYSPIIGNFIPVDPLEYIEKGMGYSILANSAASISYEGEEYTYSFDQLKANLLKGWNLVGTGSNILIPTHWCKIQDPTTRLPVNQLDPGKAYWINYDECGIPKFNIELAISATVLLLVAYSVYLETRKMRNDGIPI